MLTWVGAGVGGAAAGGAGGAAVGGDAGIGSAGGAGGDGGDAGGDAGPEWQWVLQKWLPLLRGLRQVVPFLVVAVQKKSGRARAATSSSSETRDSRLSMRELTATVSFFWCCLQQL